MLNVALDPWIPIRRKSGRRERIAPWQITVDLKGDPIVAVDATRAPWNGALTEFLIALMQTTLLPEDARAWRERWDDPPGPEDLKRQLEKTAKSFELCGEAPFLQEVSLKVEAQKDIEKYTKPVQKLLVDGVSEEQAKKNSDLFVKSGAVDALCAPCAAAALWDLQAHAPQGSAGYYTSLRGGGPVSTIVSCETLWKTVWANVLEQAAFGMKGRPDLREFLPWMKGLKGLVDPDAICPLHVLWGMPRRVFLLVSDTAGTCDTCGDVSSRMIRSFLTFRGGCRYLETSWSHPMSPYIRAKDGGSLVRRTESDIVGYRHWMGLLVDTPNGDGLPAQVVRRWVERDVPGEPDLRIWGYGYQTDQAAVACWCEGRMPFVTLTNGHRTEFEAFVRTLVAMSQRGVEKLADCLNWAWKSSDHASSLDTSDAQRLFWSSTEPLFLEQVRAAMENPAKEELGQRADAWIPLIQATALRIYEKELPAARVKPEWIARYAHKLRRLLSSRNPVTLKTRRYGDWRITDV